MTSVLETNQTTAISRCGHELARGQDQPAAGGIA